MKCKYWKECKEYEDCYTCNNEEDADGYCGVRIEKEKRKGDLK